jgi:Niemann-Pick C1 protein
MNTKGTRQERINTAIINVGSSVFIGIITTKFIGVIVLAFAPSNLFKLYYFRMYILMVFLGAFNGLVLLPVILNLIGPNYNQLKTKYEKIDQTTDHDEYKAK